MTIAIISNITISSVAVRANALTKEEIYCPKGYDVWLQEMTDPGSGLYASGADMTFVLLHGPSIIKEARDWESCAGIIDPIAATIRDAAADHREMTFVPSTLDLPDSSIRPLVSPSLRAASAARWRKSMEDIPLPLMDLAEMAADIGRRNFYNRRVWYMGGIPFSKTGEEVIAGEIDTIWRAAHTARRKCLALDLDNTLWGGVIGELGIDGLHLDRAGSGSRFYDFQKRIQELKRSGVLLVVLSKNNMLEALNGIDNHPGMALRSGDFAAILANWNPKSQNLKSAADSLNIGTDAFVFIDDNPVEREMMRMELPEVTVPEFPADSSKLEEFILDVAHRYFLQIRASDEDALKTEQYADEAVRRERKSGFASPEDYLRSLDMVLTLEELNDINLLRASQLTQKTNQFNLTSKRYSESEMKSVLESPDARAYIGDLSDRYGPYGKVTLCIARCAGGHAGIDTFLMSCRAMSRGVETAFLRAVEDILEESGIGTVHARYIKSGKNEPAEDFWMRAGYTETDRTGDGAVEYVKKLGRGNPPADGIVRVERK
ncbi:MAG: HAD-IIIC family phosphatase [Synergistaceae bacterium]|jgi:FkbH-like protein|nr:HAD-IIIC family phosphatase [Synergistaceae bacterium]